MRKTPVVFDGKALSCIPLRKIAHPIAAVVEKERTGQIGESPWEVVERTAETNLDLFARNVVTTLKDALGDPVGIDLPAVRGDEVEVGPITILPCQSKRVDFRRMGKDRLLRETTPLADACVLEEIGEKRNRVGVDGGYSVEQHTVVFNGNRT